MNLINKKEVEFVLKFRFIFFLFFSYSFQLKAENLSDSKNENSNYQYISDKYFYNRSQVNSFIDFKGYILSSGFSIYRLNSDKRFKPVSSASLSFTQKVAEIRNVGDIQLRPSLLVSQMETGKEISLELSSLMTFPEIQRRFPLYYGAGLGLGFYPFYVLEKKSTLSFHSSFLLGLRFFEIYYNLGGGLEFDLKIQFPFSEKKFYIDTMLRFQFIFLF